jgi:hypothetical protein
MQEETLFKVNYSQFINQKIFSKIIITFFIFYPSK